MHTRPVKEREVIDDTVDRDRSDGGKYDNFKYDAVWCVELLSGIYFVIWIVFVCKLYIKYLKEQDTFLRAVASAGK